MVLHVVHALCKLRPQQTVVVVGHQADAVRERVAQLAPEWANVSFAVQAHQNGTGDAASIGMANLGGDDYDDSIVVILPGDTPLLQPETLDDLVATHVSNGNAATLLTSVMSDPTGYGRVIRARDERVLRVVEQRDAAPDDLDVNEVSTSIYTFRRDLLGPALRNLTTDNAQGEFYLTDVVEALAGMGHRVGCVQAPASETQGVNDRWQLALAERELRNRTNRRWLLNGVTMLDPRQTFIDVTVDLGRDVTIYPGTMLQGATTIGSGCDIGPDTRLENCSVGNDVVLEYTVGRNATIESGAEVGPYAFLGPGTSVFAGHRTGAFYTATTD